METAFDTWVKLYGPLTGYRKMKNAVRQWAGIHEHGAKLFQKAFLEESSCLKWEVKDKSEQIGRAQLFVGATMAFRNPRAHREPGEDFSKDQRSDLLYEFMLLNHLFRLAKAAKSRAKAVSE